MTSRIATLAFLVFTVVAVGQPAPKGKKKDESPAGYKKDNLRGFTLYFSDEVLKNDRESKLERKPLEALERELIIVETVLPADKVKHLKAVPIWVEWDDRLDMNNGRAGSAVAVFFGGHQAGLLAGNVAKSNSVTILSLRSLTNEHQPKTDSGRCVTLHELAHAYHHLAIGNNPYVENTFRQAMERKLYDRSNYAATNHREYFAELTCAYLDRLDYFPRTRDELKKHDPKGFEMMEKLWGKVVERKDALAKGPKLPSADGDGKYPLTLHTTTLALGEAVTGEVPAKTDWKGRPVLLYVFSPGSGRSQAQLSKVAAWDTDLREFGLLTMGAATGKGPDEMVRQLVRQRNVGFPITAGLFQIGGAGSFTLPHAIVYDHTGKCVFRGEPLDAEPYARIAVGKAALARLEKDTFGKPAQPVVDLLQRGAPMPQVFAKIAEQLRNTSKDAAEDVRAIQGVLIEGGKKALASASEKVKDYPAEAFFEAERLAAVYKATPVEKGAAELVTKLRSNAKVAPELRARPSLEAIKKLDTQLSGRDQSFNPRSLDFKASNAVLLKQLEDAVEKMRKQYPAARATEEAVKVAERWDLKLK